MDTRIINKIGELKGTSTYRDIIEIVEFDFKSLSEQEYITKYLISIKKEKLLYSDKYFSTNIDKYFKYRHTNEILKKAVKKIFEADNNLFIRQIYEKLSWDNGKDSDTINSFANIYITGHSIFYKKNEKLLSASNAPYFYKKNYSKLNQKDYLEKFARMTHSFGNFMPCPCNEFNTAKGFLNDVKDFLPLMIDKIEKCIANKICLEYQDNGKNVTVSLKILESWKDFFLKNREKFLLEEYYFLIERYGIRKMIGIPFFKTQSLSRPSPLNEEEFKECVEEMNRRIKARGIRMIINVIMKNIENTVDN